jgi:tRNA(Ile)-lysidine synthase
MANKAKGGKNFSEIKLLDRYASSEPMAVAVSGGPDSTALMFLVSQSKSFKNNNVTILVVDHSLRKDSANEARMVCSNAKTLGFKYKILQWRGDKPLAGIQEAARIARYNLMSSWCENNNIDTLFLGHHLGDQVETFLMRLSKGSGIDGLSSMSKISSYSNTTLVRPFLEVSKKNLIEIAKASKLKWISDPTNLNSQFQRARIRRILPILSKEGIDPHHINLVIKRMESAKQALNDITTIHISSFVKNMSDISYSLSYGCFSILPMEILLRILERLIMVASGSIYPPRRAKVESILSWLEKGGGVSAKTLSGTIIRRRKDYIIFYRELKGCQSQPVINPLTNRYLSWDNRFKIKLNKSKKIEVKALGDEGIKILKSKKILKKQGLNNIPLSAWKSVPGLWSKKRLISVPSLGYCVSDDLKVYIKSIRQP